MKRKQSKSNKTIYILAGVFSGVGCILMVAFPELALNAADRGISLFLNSVLPSLLPFFICANFMIALGVPAIIGRYFEGLFRKLFRAPGASAFVFVISITSGYPMGAKLIGDMGRRGEISLMDGRRMLAFCTTSGPLFMLGTVGASMLGQSRAGVVIAVSHYAAALLNGLLFRVILDHSGTRLPQRGGWNEGGAQISTQRRPKADTAKNREIREGLLEEFTRCILSSFQTLGVICGYIVLFTLLTDFLQFSGALNLLDSVWQKGIAKGVLEMTVGAGSIASSTEISMVAKCALCSMLISFGGISITAQSISMLSGFNVGIWYYLRVKICHGLIALGLAFLIGPRLLAGSVSAGNFGGTEAVHALGSVYGMLFSIKMLGVVMVLFFVTCAVQNAIDSFRRGMEKRRLRKEKKAADKERRLEERAAARETDLKRRESERRRKEAERRHKEKEKERERERKQRERQEQREAGPAEKEKKKRAAKEKQAAAKEQKAAAKEKKTGAKKKQAAGKAKKA